MTVHFDILTIFPEVFPGPLGVGVIGKALKEDLIRLTVHQLRDYTTDKHRSVDDYPYGGGAGMVMKPEPVFECMDTLKKDDPFVVLLSPQGVPWTQHRARELLSRHHRFALICGRYEGVDERIREYLASPKEQEIVVERPLLEILNDAVLDEPLTNAARSGALSSMVKEGIAVVTSAAY